MEKDLIIGNATNYEWDDIKYWINSIKKSGFSGDVILVASNISKETIDIVKQKGAVPFLYGKETPEGDYKLESNNIPHVARFFYMWNAIHSRKERYRYIITTDTRDVVFQKNPSEWIENNIGQKRLIASSEGMRYKNEPWGNQNLLDAFGPFFHNALKDELIYNVGTVAGTHDYVESLMLMIFQLSVNRPIPIVDQATFNFIINTYPYIDDTLFTKNDDGWSIQLGTTIKSVESGSGDLGKIFGENTSKLIQYQMLYEDTHPVIEDNIIKNKEGIIFTIVHQYDRIPEIKEKIMELYGE